MSVTRLPSPVPKFHARSEAITAAAHCGGTVNDVTSGLSKSLVKTRPSFSPEKLYSAKHHFRAAPSEAFAPSSLVALVFSTDGIPAHAVIWQTPTLRPSRVDI
jgi:hypothetical protein